VDMFGMRTWIHCRVPRFDCVRHGVHRLPVPWATPVSRFTLVFEAIGRDIAASTGLSAMATRLGISRDEALGILRRG
jgi:hypothetical protein